MKFPPACIFLLTATWWTTVPAAGESINWYSPPQKTNLASTGGAMDGAFQFQLGVFTGGFIPTPANMGQWPGHWVPAQSASYNADTGSFDELCNVTGNAAPFTVGAKAWIWGRSEGNTSDEWILLRGTGWNWPAPNPLNPFPKNWNVAAADEVIIGSLHIGGSPFLMRSAAVVSYAQWAALELADEPLDAAGDDPDHDGAPNLLEFVFGTPPLQPNAPTYLPLSLVEAEGQKFLQIRVPRQAGRIVTLTVEVSGDLLDWRSGESGTLVVGNDEDAWTVRDLTPWDPQGAKRFIRLKATLP